MDIHQVTHRFKEVYQNREEQVLLFLRERNLIAEVLFDALANKSIVLMDVNRLLESLVKEYI